MNTLFTLLLSTLLSNGIDGEVLRPPESRDSTRQMLVWRADNGDGTYTNPILHADYSDPDVLHIGERFYLTASSFVCSPGLPILKSPDLVNWSIVGHALQSVPPAAHYSTPRHGNGVWAPAMRIHGGEVLIYYGDPDFGIYRVSAPRPEGPWGPPMLIAAAKGWIDPCPFWDDDGQAYLIHAWAKSRAGLNGVLTLRRMNADGTGVFGDSVNVFSAPDRHPTMEGPKLYKREGLYYIFAPAGGVKAGWQVVLRSSSIDGPYEDRVVLNQGSTAINGPHQGAWVRDVAGESWFVHFQDKGPYGRVVHLQPMEWVDGWPVIGVDTDRDDIGEPVLRFRKPVSSTDSRPSEPQTGDEFADTTLGLQWQWLSNPDPGALELRFHEGQLRLSYALPSDAYTGLSAVPGVLLQKFPAPAFSATARMDVRGMREGDRAGMIVMGEEFIALAVRRSDNQFLLERGTRTRVLNGGRESWSVVETLSRGVLTLRMTVHEGARVTASIGEDSELFREAGEEFQAVPGRWVGARVGVLMLTHNANSPGSVLVDWFRVASIH